MRDNCTFSHASIASIGNFSFSLAVPYGVFREKARIGQRGQVAGNEMAAGEGAEDSDKGETRGAVETLVNKDEDEEEKVDEEEKEDEGNMEGDIKNKKVDEDEDEGKGEDEDNEENEDNYGETMNTIKKVRKKVLDQDGRVCTSCVSLEAKKDYILDLQDEIIRLEKELQKMTEN